MPWKLQPTKFALDSITYTLVVYHGIFKISLFYFEEFMLEKKKLKKKKLFTKFCLGERSKVWGTVKPTSFKSLEGERNWWVVWHVSILDHPHFFYMMGIFSSRSLECEEVFWLPHQCQLTLSLVHTWVDPLLIYVYLLGPCSMYTWQKFSSVWTSFTSLEGKRKLVSRVACHPWPIPHFFYMMGFFSSLSLECERSFLTATSVPTHS